ncbi:MAG TPA: hypothetical protein VFN52_03365 [Acidiferrobacteraceae bacterium]|nr:hypothetical protein [Acidiferrobacteraceae bacterium]
MSNRLPARAHGALAASALRPAGPLYERAPTRDEDGTRLSDFMMLIPGLRARPEHQFRDALRKIEMVLAQFQEVVFIDLNVPLNLLWVSVRPRPGVILEIASTLKFHVPDMLLVGPRLLDAKGHY